MNDSHQEYIYPVQTNFDKRHIIFGKLAEVESWCVDHFGLDSYIRVVSMRDDWRLTYKFKYKEHAVFFALRWI